MDASYWTAPFGPTRPPTLRAVRVRSGRKKLPPPILAVTPSDSVVTNQLFDLNDGGTGFIAEMLCENNTERAIRIDHVRVELPRFEPRFRLLTPIRRGPAAGTYDFPEPGPVNFLSNDVLNRRIRSHARFLLGEYFEGLLLGMGDETMPEKYVDRMPVRIRLSLFQTNGRVATIEMKLGVWRSPKYLPLQARMKALRDGRQQSGHVETQIDS